MASLPRNPFVSWQPSVRTFTIPSHAPSHSRNPLRQAAFTRSGELEAISDECKAHGLSLHMDGARFANACASLGCRPAEITWRSGVDVLCFGGTKNGMAVGEAVLFFDRKLAADFDYRCKQAGQLASKMRFLSAPWVGMLESGAWLRNATHANHCARHCAAQIANIPGVCLARPRRGKCVISSSIGRCA